MSEEEINKLAAHLENQLLNLYKTPLLTDQPLRDCLGYPSSDAMRQAIVRNTIPIKVFTIKNRRGKFELVRDVAYWLAEQSLASNNDDSKLDSANKLES